MDKSARYDRQVRLWHTGGQFRLELAHVCVINGNATSAEILKNLVLPGIGEFTVVDGHKVSETDLSGNFFLEDGDIGSGLAKALCKNLCELNSEVRGHAVEDCIEVLAAQNEFWLQFDVVVVTGRITQNALDKIEAVLWERNIPLLRVLTCGFYGALRIARYESTIFETHNPSPTFDLRIDCPWPELSAYVESFDLEELDDTEHAHVPYIVIYIKALEQWRVANNKLNSTQLPRTYAEKTDFRQNFIERMARDMGLEANFIEASQAIHRALQQTNVPTAILSLFSREETSDTYLKNNFSPFWLYVRALSLFIEDSNGVLPLPGVLPDMVSTTSRYVELQKIYRDKATADQIHFGDIVRKLYEKFCKGEVPDQVSMASFCKSAGHLHVNNGSHLNANSNIMDDLRKVSNQPQDPRLMLVAYFGMLTLDRWNEQENDQGFQQFLIQFCDNTNINESELNEECRKTLQEVFIHNCPGYLNVCSYMGGIVSQEILKIVTSQYIPLDNLYIFDGIKSVSEKWKAL